MEAQGADEAARQSAEELFSQDAAKDTVRRRLVARKAVDYLTAIAKGENPPDPAPAKVTESDSPSDKPESEEMDETETEKEE